MVGAKKAGELHIGAVNNTGGPITIEGDTAFATDIETGANPDVTELWLHSAGDVVGSGAIAVTDLAIVSGGSVNLTSASVANLAVQATAAVSVTSTSAGWNRNGRKM